VVEVSRSDPMLRCLYHSTMERKTLLEPTMCPPPTLLRLPRSEQLLRENSASTNGVSGQLKLRRSTGPKFMHQSADRMGDHF